MTDDALSNAEPMPGTEENVPAQFAKCAHCSVTIYRIGKGGWLHVDKFAHDRWDYGGGGSYRSASTSSNAGYYSGRAAGSRANLGQSSVGGGRKAIGGGR